MRPTRCFAGVLTLVALGGCTSTVVDDRPVTALSGAELYERLCSSCHGATAHGDGPVAPLIKTGVPDLTLMAQRSSGEFPADGVRGVIDGRSERPAHGPRDMPVWGWQLYDPSARSDDAAREQVDGVIDRLVSYLQSVQRS